MGYGTPKDMIKIFFFLLGVCVAGVVYAGCTDFTPKITLRTLPGSVNYITDQTREQFIGNAPGPVSPNTVGLTVAKMSLTVQGKPLVQQDARRACVGIKEVTFDMGYEVLDVYIDKRYKPGSCEYAEVKAHENYHVAVSNQAMKFFRPDLEKALRKAVKNMRPEFVYSEAEAGRVLKRQFDQILSQVQPVIDHINTKIAEKNYVIDTPQSYADTTAKCHNW